MRHVDTRFLPWGLGMGAAAALAACSLANAPPEPSPAPTGGGGSSVGGGTPTSSTSTVGGGGMGGMIDPNCGNGTVDGDEDCDDGMETATCDVDCTAVECGDGRINRTAGERCDDGNTDTGDACDDSCQPSIFDVSAVEGDAGFLFLVLQPDVAVVEFGDTHGFEVAFTQIADPDLQIAVRRYDALGGVEGPAVVVGDGQTEATPSMATSESGARLVAWTDGDTQLVRYRIFAPNLSPAVQTVPGSDGAGIKALARQRPGGGFCIEWNDQANGRVKIACLDDEGAAMGTTRDLGISDPSGDGNILGPIELVPYQGGFLSLFWSAPDELSAKVLSNNGVQAGGNSVIGTAPSFSWTSGLLVTGDADFLAAWSAQPTDDDYEVDMQPMLNQNAADGNAVRFTTTDVQHVGYELIEHEGRYAFLYGETPTGTSIYDGCSLNLRPVDAKGVVNGDATTVVPLQIGDCPLFASAAVGPNGDVFVVWSRSGGGMLRTQGLLLPGYLAP